MTAAMYLPILAALLGFSLARANSCTFAAVIRLVDGGRSDWLIGLGIAGSVAGAMLAVLTIWRPELYALPARPVLTWGPFLGGAIMGLGAVANRGCMLGSVSALGRGNLNYLLTLLGLALSLTFSRSIYDLPMQGEGADIAGFVDAPGWPLFVAGFAALILWGLFRLVREKSRAMPYVFLTGIFGAALFATNPYWSYLAALDRTVKGDLFVMTLTADIAAVTLFLGATLSAWLRERLDLKGFRTKEAVGCLIGGFTMGLGAQMIPGGNDTLLLWTIPGLATYGLVGYLMMIVTIALVLVVRKRLRKEPA